MDRDDEPGQEVFKPLQSPPGDPGSMNAPGTGACAMCGCTQLKTMVRNPDLVVTACRECGYATGAHTNVPTNEDYHSQYDQNDFLEALRVTRERQARVIVSRIRSILPDADSIFDYGHGRGWFLKACQSAGFTRIAGSDSSELSMQWLRENKFAEFAVSPDGRVQTTSFKPKVLSLLDVVEHFDLDALKAFLGNILASLAPELKLVVIKVPLTDGLLYRTAGWLSRMNFFDPINQLYQVGTNPPHLGYFSNASMEVFLKQAGLNLVDRIGDCEIEPAYFSDRVTAIKRFPKFVGSALGHGISLASSVSGRHDSMVFFART